MRYLFIIGAAVLAALALAPADAAAQDNPGEVGSVFRCFSICAPGGSCGDPDCLTKCISSGGHCGSGEGPLGSVEGLPVHLTEAVRSLVEAAEKFSAAYGVAHGIADTDDGRQLRTDIEAGLSDLLDAWRYIRGESPPLPTP